MSASDFSHEEASLIGRIAGGVPADQRVALRTIYGRYADLLFAFVHHHIGERADAEDVWQETWLAAIRGISRFQAKSSFFTGYAASRGTRFRIISVVPDSATEPSPTFHLNR